MTLEKLNYYTLEKFKKRQNQKCETNHNYIIYNPYKT